MRNRMSFMFSTSQQLFRFFYICFFFVFYPCIFVCTVASSFEVFRKHRRLELSHLMSFLPRIFRNNPTIQIFTIFIHSSYFLHNILLISVIQNIFANFVASEIFKIHFLKNNPILLWSNWILWRPFNEKKFYTGKLLMKYVAVEEF